VAFTTSDGGLSWTAVHVPDEVALTTVQFPSADVGYVLAQRHERDPVLLRSVDGGRTWQSGAIPRAGWVSDMAFVDPDTGYLVVDDTILKTVDGGRMWSGYRVSGVGRFMAVDFPTALTGYAVGFTSDELGPVAVKTVDAGAGGVPLGPAVPAPLGSGGMLHAARETEGSLWLLLMAALLLAANLLVVGRTHGHRP
jgi:photosystem II stability/assembly factor-like uncharacterized protein